MGFNIIGSESSITSVEDRVRLRVISFSECSQLGRNKSLTSFFNFMAQMRDIRSIAKT